MKQTIAVTIVMFSLFCYTALAAVESPALPAWFYGDATVNGRDIPVGSYIIGKIEGENSGQLIVIEEGEYGDSDTHRKLAVIGNSSTRNKQIDFHLSLPGMREIKSQETFNWLPGSTNKLNLNFVGSEIELPEPEENDTSSSSSSSSSTSTSGTRPSISELDFPASVASRSKMLKFSYSKIKEIDIVLDSLEIPVTMLQLRLNKNVTDVKISIETLDAPNVALLEGGVYKYFEIDAPKIPDSVIDAAVIRFQVSNEWLKTYDSNKVKLLRFSDNEWSKLDTVSLGSDLENHQYTARTPGFSVFAIISEEMAIVPIAQPSAESEPQEVSVIEIAAEPEDETEPEQTERSSFVSDRITGMFIRGNGGETNPLGLVVVLLIFIVLVGVAYYFIEKK